MSLTWFAYSELQGLLIFLLSGSRTITDQTHVLTICTTRTFFSGNLWEIFYFFTKHYPRTPWLIWHMWILICPVSHSWVVCISLFSPRLKLKKITNAQMSEFSSFWASLRQRTSKVIFKGLSQIFNCCSIFYLFSSPTCSLLNIIETFPLELRCHNTHYTQQTQLQLDCPFLFNDRMQSSCSCLNIDGVIAIGYFMSLYSSPWYPTW